MALTEIHKQIWIWFQNVTQLPDAAIAGIMGNLQAESNCEAMRKQGDFSADRHTSLTYTEQADSGSIPANKWSTDSIGYGLAQWTYYTRKMELLNFAKATGESVGNLELQLRFLVSEMQQDYSSMWARLMSCTDIAEASNMVLVEYERPAILNKAERISYSKEIYEAYHNMPLYAKDPLLDDGDTEEDAWIDDEVAFLEEEKARLQARIDYYKARRTAR